MKTQISRWSIFFACTTAVLAALPVWLVVPSYSQTNAVGQQRPDEDIIFPPKAFLNLEAYVWIVGTLTGDWVAFKNNT